MLGKTGSIPLRAFRLDNDFLDLYKTKQVSTKSLLEKHFGTKAIFKELEIEAQNTLLIGSFISALGSSGQVSLFSDVDENALDKSMAKNLEFLGESVDDLSSQMSRLYGYSRAAMKQQHNLSSLKQKKASITY